ncbi:MAG: hypothetical protein ACREFN_17130, partial [Acetobacteraceae bacterium]
CHPVARDPARQHLAEPVNARRQLVDLTPQLANQLERVRDAALHRMRQAHIRRIAADLARLDQRLVAVIGPTLEGETTEQRNPHPLQSLAWISWIIARLGGWTGDYKPPGPKVMRRGWDRFEAMAAGYLLATRSIPPQLVTDHV